MTTCRFHGSAAEVHIEGSGTVQLTLGDAFSSPFARRVELVGARIGAAGPLVVLEPAGDLEPVEMASEGPAYDVTYGAGETLVVEIRAGGEAGHVRGAVPEMPECEQAWCDVVWTAGQAKKLVVTPASGAQGDVPITGPFPFERPGTFDKEVTAKVTAVTARGARGTLECDAERRELVGAELVWRVGESGALEIKPGLAWRGGELSLSVESEMPPAATAAPWWPWAAGAGAALIAALLAWRIARAGTRRSGGESGTQGDAERGPLPEAPGSGAADVFYSFAPQDEPLLKELIKHLRLLEHRGVIRGWHSRQISAGLDHRKEVDARIDRAKVVLLLVSADYIASDYAYGAEMTRALRRREEGECAVIPVLLRPVAGWEKAPFGKLSVLPRNGRPVTDKEAWPTLDAAFADVAAGVEKALAKAPEGAGTAENR